MYIYYLLGSPVTTDRHCRTNSECTLSWMFRKLCVRSEIWRCSNVGNFSTFHPFLEMNSLIENPLIFLSLFSWSAWESFLSNIFPTSSKSAPKLVAAVSVEDGSIVPLFSFFFWSRVYICHINICLSLTDAYLRQLPLLAIFIWLICSGIFREIAMLKIKKLSAISIVTNDAIKTDWLFVSV